MSASTHTGNANKNHNEALVEAIWKRQFEEVKNLLEHHLDNIDINGEYNMKTPLQQACGGRFNRHMFPTPDARIVALLLEYGADPNHGNKVVEINGERYNSNENAPIWYAMDDVFSLLLRYGADPNVVRPRSGWSILQWVCDDDDYDKIELLLRHGANPNQLDNEGESPLLQMFDALFFNHLDDNKLSCLRLMLEYGADPNMIGRWGTTPLFRVIRNFNGRLDAVRLMMQHGGNVTIPLSVTSLSDRGRIERVTVLHAAVLYCDVDAIRVMTECQPITTFWWLRDHNGDTVYDVAAKWDNPSIIEYFDTKLRQLCYAHLLYDWIRKKPCMKTMTMIHHIDDAEMPLGAEKEQDGIYATVLLPTKSWEDPNADRKDERGTFVAKKKRKNCDIMSTTGLLSQHDSIGQDAIPSKKKEKKLTEDDGNTE